MRRAFRITRDRIAAVGRIGKLLPQIQALRVMGQQSLADVTALHGSENYAKNGPHILTECDRDLLGEEIDAIQSLLDTADLSETTDEKLSKISFDSLELAALFETVQAWANGKPIPSEAIPGMNSALAKITEARK